jgi:hypothetical protein
VEKGDAEVCYSDPGGDPDVMVRERSLPFVNWHRWVAEWNDLLRAGDVEITGPRRPVRSVPTWNLRRPELPAAPVGGVSADR